MRELKEVVHTPPYVQMLSLGLTSICRPAKWTLTSYMQNLEEQGLIFAPQVRYYLIYALTIGLG